MTSSFIDKRKSGIAKFEAYDVRVTRGPRKGETAHVVGYGHVGPLGETQVELTCKFADGTYKMIPEAWTVRLEDRS